MKSLEELADEGLLITSWESEVVRQQLYDIIKEASIERTVGRQCVEINKMTSGTTLDMILADKDSMEFRRVSEGARIPIDVEAYTKISVTPAKWALQVIVAQEVQEDANWDIIKRNLRQAGREAAVREDLIIFGAFNDSTNGFHNTNSVSAAGSELSIKDIVDGMKAVEDDDYEPNRLVIHPTQLGELRQIDTFVEADKLGSREMLLTGQVGTIFGMSVLVSRSAWVGQTSTEYAWVIDSRNGGVLVVRRPLTMKSYEIPDRDALGVAISFRAEARVVRGEAGCRISGM